MRMGGVIAVGEKGIESDGYVDLGALAAEDPRLKPLLKSCRLVLTFDGQGFTAATERFQALLAGFEAAWQEGEAAGGSAEAFVRVRRLVECYRMLQDPQLI
ncbi:hypothetical protein HYW67_03075 [Candidatus Parcubacteria bacterium]|nr:hypothetical protein [Candidatus Parcubacteria bacterium]